MSISKEAKLAAAYDFEIRLDGTIMGEGPVDVLLSTVWHSIRIQFFADSFKFTVDGNTSTHTWEGTIPPNQCLLFAMSQSVQAYIDNIIIR